MTTKVEFEQSVLDSFYRTERSWGSYARWLSCAGALLLIASTEHRMLTGVVLVALSIPCQVISMLAMRGARRLEDQRLARMNRQHEQVMAERRDGQP